VVSVPLKSGYNPTHDIWSCSRKQVNLTAATSDGCRSGDSHWGCWLSSSQRWLRARSSEDYPYSGLPAIIPQDAPTASEQVEQRWTSHGHYHDNNMIQHCWDLSFRHFLAWNSRSVRTANLPPRVLPVSNDVRSAVQDTRRICSNRLWLTDSPLGRFRWWELVITRVAHFWTDRTAGFKLYVYGVASVLGVAIQRDRLGWLTAIERCSHIETGTSGHLTECDLCLYRRPFVRRSGRNLHVLADDLLAIVFDE